MNDSDVNNIDEPQKEAITTRVFNYFDSRIGFEGMIHFARKKDVPMHRYSVWYAMGGITLFFFIVQLVTGFLLLVYYRPSEAHASMLDIMGQVEFGWLIRSLHSWSSNLMVFFAFVHMFSVFFMRAYSKMRDLGWYTGIILLMMTFGLGFTGYALPGDELAFFATKIGIDIAETMPFGLGVFAADILRGGSEISATTLQRLFALHAAVLPVLFFPVLGLHLWLVQQHGNHVPDGVPLSEVKRIKFFPAFYNNELIIWLLCLNVLTILAAVFPWHLGPEADPIAPAPLGIKPEWYYMAQFQILKIIPAEVMGISGEFVGMGLFGLAAGMWAMVPIFDRTEKRARHILYSGYFVLVALIVLTVWGYM